MFVFSELLHQNQDHLNGSKVYLLYLHNHLKNKEASEQLNFELLDKLSKLLPKGDWYSYCLKDNNTEDMFTRLKQIIFESSNYNILNKLNFYSNLENSAMTEENNKIFLMDFLTDNINEKDYDTDTKESLMQLYDLIVSGKITSPEDLQKYGLIL